MKPLILPILMLLTGAGSGVGAGLLLKPAADEAMPEAEGPCGDPATEAEKDDIHPSASVTDDRAFTGFKDPFLIPVVEGGKIAAMVIVAVSLEVDPEQKPIVEQAEPRLRDALLEVMFDHANIGGFSGNFTNGTSMRSLRNDLRRAAQLAAGDRVRDVLITEIVRQDQ